MDLKALIKETPDFPKQGILFRDISPLLKSPAALDYCAQELIKGVDLSKIDYFAGIESRGFILAMLMSAKHGKGFLPIRKAGKLPPPVVSQRYLLEYGEAEIELNPGQGRIMVLDDVLATGGTLRAAIEVSEKAGYEIVDVGVLINLTFLNNMSFKERPIRSLLQY
jgi:adenine phosphoribosyltransferase